MSLNQLLQDSHKEWLDIRVNNLTVDNQLDVKTLHVTGNLDVDGKTTTGSFESKGLGTFDQNMEVKGISFLDGEVDVNDDIKMTNVTKGLYLPNPTGLPFKLDYYEQFQLTGVTATGPFPAPVAVGTIDIFRIGKIVTLNIPSFSSEAKAPGILSEITLSPALPARFRPTLGVAPTFYCTVIRNASPGFNNLGSVLIGANGVIKIWNGNEPPTDNLNNSPFGGLFPAPGGVEAGILTVSVTYGIS